MKNTWIKWLPSLIVMGVIFWFSAQPDYSLPNFNSADKIVKKGAHMMVYASLAISYWYGWDLKKEKKWLAWLLAFLYAMTDEFHQSFTPGRHPSVWDVVVFDNLGAMFGLWLTQWWLKRKRPSTSA